MSNYEQLQADIADELGNDGELTVDHIKKAIARSIAKYERRSWWFNETLVTFQTVAGQEYYGAAANANLPNLIQINNATIETNGYRTPLVEDGFEIVDDAQTGGITGVPCNYTILTGEIRLYPIPDAIYSIRLAGTGRLAALAAGGDSNAWTTFAEELIRQSAKARLAIDILQSPDVAARFVPLINSAYDDLLEENRRRHPIKRLRTDLPSNGSFNVLTGV